MFACLSRQRDLPVKCRPIAKISKFDILFNFTSRSEIFLNFDKRTSILGDCNFGTFVSVYLFTVYFSFNQTIELSSRLIPVNRYRYLQYTSIF